MEGGAGFVPPDEEDIPSWARDPRPEPVMAQHGQPSAIRVPIESGLEACTDPADLPSWMAQDATPVPSKTGGEASYSSSWTAQSSSLPFVDSFANQPAWCDSEGQSPLLPPLPESSNLFRPSSLERASTCCEEFCTFRTPLLPLLVLLGLGNLFVFIFRLMLACSEFVSWAEAGSMVECSLAGLMTYMLFHKTGGIWCCKVLCGLCSTFEVVLALCEWVSNDCSEHEDLPAMMIPLSDTVLFALWALAAVLFHCIARSKRKEAQQLAQELKM